MAEYGHGHKQIPGGVLVLVIVVVAAIAFSMIGGEDSVKSVDVNSPVDIGQDIKPNNPPVAVETETPSETRVLLPPEVVVTDVSGTTIKIKITNSCDFDYQCVGVGVYLKNFEPNRKGVVVPKDFFIEPKSEVYLGGDLKGALPRSIKEIQVTDTWIEGSYFIREE